MKRLLLAVVLLLFTEAAGAQETYSVAATATQVAQLRQHVLAGNRATCRRLGLAATCTQAQACTAANAAGGASCTPAQARASGVRIWPDSQAGREEYVLWQWVAPRFLEAKDALPPAVYADYCVWWASQNTTTRDAECTKVGAPTGCSMCQ